MGLKKYEIITVGSDKRVRALRSWQVQGRYVNIGDVGGIVYDEKTLSQDGACWLFRGNFNFPGARIGGDSVVDVGEVAPDAAGSANLDILGTSAVVGAPVRFSLVQTAEDTVVLTADDFEQGTLSYVLGTNWETMKVPSGNNLRTKNPIFAGGVSTVLKCEVPGYLLNWYALDRDGVTINASATVTTGVGVTTTVSPCQYFLVRLSKNPNAHIVPADATAAQIKMTASFETKLVMVNSRLELNPANSTGVITIRPGGTYTVSAGAKYPDSVIQNSCVSINAPVNNVRFMSELSNVRAEIDATSASIQVIGRYSNIKNLVFGNLSVPSAVSARSLIQAYDCDNMVVNPTNFPGLAAMQTAGVPIKFYNCNLNNGRFYHHAQIANTYRDIDFEKASADLGKLTPNGYVMASSEVEGMYRLCVSATNTWGCLVEAYGSVSRLTIPSIITSYGTTIYKDAYFNGLFDIAGTNVFGHKVRSHPLEQVLNVQPRAVQGGFNTTITPPTVVPEQTQNTVMNVPLRINGANGLKVENVPAGVRYRYVILDTNLKFVQNSSWKTGASTIEASLLRYPYAMITFNRESGSALTPEDLAGVTVTVYNGCKIVNTGTTAVNMKGNIRVEDNATLVNASVTGSGYFGGNSVVYYNPTVWASLDFNGTVYMKDDTVFAPSALTGASALVRMEGNAKFTGSVDVASTNLSFIMRDNAVIEGKANTRSGVVMSGNSKVTAAGQITADSRGVLVMEENASIEANTTVIGAITLSGNYKGNAVKTWTGKRAITDVNEPEYDNNVKTQYDF